ncbi:MAG: Na+/H+ antiporter NhaA [Candidatus Paracaedibacteraceae bacterium]|nr:Na+/H+ antiporter NhaA [Candidatus Paracaedibacteraceae bacterium]
MKKRTDSFINLEVLSGILLFISMILALCVSNTELYDEYQALAKLPIGLSIGKFTLSKSLLKWVNDGLMALFFLILTLEAKYHCLEGDYSSFKSLRLPLICAIGGVIVPISVYLLTTSPQEDFMKGWAVPIATDTAFILAILAIFIPHTPTSVRLFVVAFSIIDDVIAVLILAFFYTPFIQLIPLLVSIICVLGLAVLNKSNLSKLWPYITIGIILWIGLTETGIHGTLAGVILGCFIPVRTDSKIDISCSPLKRLEHYLHPFVALTVLPLFAFLNSEIAFNEISWNDFFAPITKGIFLGLFIGKQLGVMAFAYIGTKFNLCKLPSNISWKMFYGISLLVGIGFTFSLFIGVLSFEDSTHINQMKLGVMLGSFISAIAGIAMLKYGRAKVLPLS